MTYFYKTLFFFFFFFLRFHTLHICKYQLTAVLRERSIKGCYLSYFPVSILYKSKTGRYRPVRVADGPITARYRFIKNAIGVWMYQNSQKKKKKKKKNVFFQIDFPVTVVLIMYHP